jgi:hypothetical protein
MKVATATLWSTMVYLLLPLIFLFYGWFEMQSPDWDTNDSGAVQGFYIGFLASISALFCVVIFFPLVALKLGHRFTKRKWVYLNL